MDPITPLLRRWIRRAPESCARDLSRIETLSDAQAAAIPEADLVSERFDREASPPTSRMLVVLSTPRSGSTFLCQLLHCVGLCTPHEYFQREQYLPLLAHRWGCVDGGRISWSCYASALERHRTSDEGVLGINLHGSHLPRFMRALSSFSATDIKYIWLQRRDKLRQAVSFGIARQTGQWSSEFKKSAEAEYNFAFYSRQLQEIHRQEDNIRAFLCLMPTSCDIVYYEDLVAEPDAALRSLLGVAVGDTTVSGDRALRRQGNATNEDFLRRLAHDLFHSR